MLEVIHMQSYRTVIRSFSPDTRVFANYDQSGDGTISPTELVLKFSRLPGKEVAKSVKLSGIMREADQESTSTACKILSCQRLLGLYTLASPTSAVNQIAEKV